ncbi:MAG: DUF421 domain-containing protein, partial [Clostridia bacterium]|nr:DUF421 domain-containing protein [Clostridia bacterium]
MEYFIFPRLFYGQDVILLEYLKLIFTAVFSLFALFLLTRITGNKQLSHLTMFDYINGITIGSIAAEMATELEEPLKPLLAMTVYTLSVWIISVLSLKFLPVRRIFFGRSLLLMKNGKILRQNLKRAHLDLNEFLMKCRYNGYFDLSQIDTAILEPSGNISFLPFPDCRPATPRDLKIVPSNDSIFYNVIMDGKILPKNLSDTGYNEQWLQNELQAQGIQNIQDVFLAILDVNGSLHLFLQSNDDPTRQPLPRDPAAGPLRTAGAGLGARPAL